MQDPVTSATAIVGMVTGIIGAVLALWSIRRQIADDRVNLRVRMMCAMRTDQPGMFITVSITNLSKFPVSIQDAGVLVSTGQRIIFNESAIKAPYRMEPRTAVSFMAPADELASAPEFRHAACLYAQTACGEMHVGGHSDMRATVKNLLST